MLNDKLTMDLSFMYSNVKEQNMLSQGEYANPLVPFYLFPLGDDFSKYQYYERYDVDRNIKTQFWPLKENGLSMQNPSGLRTGICIPTRKTVFWQAVH